MRSCMIGLIIFVVAELIILPRAHAQTAPLSGAGKAIPDLSGIWQAVPAGPAAARSPCGEPACLALLGISVPKRLGEIVTTIEEPQMLAWAEEKYKAAREGVQDPNDFGREEMNPWMSGCASPGPAWIMLNGFEALELLQFPDVVLLLSSDDHAVRHIYLDGRGHPRSPAATQMGHSTGRYDGDTLVVDTVGIRDISWIDLQGHPHSDALHLVERIRRLDQKSLEIVVTIDDPKTYKKPWTKKIVRLFVPPGPRLGDDALCSELLKLGTHYSAESK